MSRVRPKQQHGGSKNPRQPACFITRDTNTIRLTQARITCAMVATWRIREVFVTLFDSSFIAIFSSDLKKYSLLE